MITFADMSNLTILGFALAIATFFQWLITNSLKEAASQKRIVSLLGGMKSFKSSYFSLLTTFMQRFSAKVAKGPWTPEAYDWVLRVAFWYPVTAYVVTWLVSGETTAGLQGGMADNVPLERRLLVLVCLATSTFLYDRATQSAVRGWATHSFLAVSLLAAAAFFANGGGSFVVIAAVCVASTVSIINGTRGAVTKRVGFGTAKAFLGGAVFGFALALVLGQLSITAPYARGMVFVGLIASIASVFSFLGAIARLRNFIGAFLVVQWLSFVLGGFVVARFLSAADYDPAFVSLYVMWGILPFVNAPFDWVSLAITVTLVGKMVRSSGGNIFTNTVVDYVLGVFLLFGLSLFLLVLLGTYHHVAVSHGNVSVLNPISLIEEIRADPANPRVYWVYAMVSTTMWPKLVHTTAAAATLGIKLIGVLGPWAKKQLKGDISNDFFLRNLVGFYLTVGLVVVISLALFFAAAAFWIVVVIAPYVGQGMLAMGEAIVPSLAGIGNSVP